MTCSILLIMDIVLNDDTFIYTVQITIKKNKIFVNEYEYEFAD